MFPRSIHNFKIIRKDGKVYDCYELGLFVNSFRDNGISLDDNPLDVDGTDGLLDGGTRRKERKMSAEITIESVDHYDYDLLKDEIYRLFDSKESFYIVRDVQPGKRYEVKCDSPFSIARIAYELGEFSISLVAYRPFAESIGTTMNPFTFDSELWQIGQGLVAEDVQYIHKTSSFRIHNAGDVEIDPRKLPLVVRVRGATNGLTITNRTTGDVFKLNIPTASGDTIELNRVRVLKNGNTVFSSTNRKVIKIATGWNDFIVSGVTGAFQIEFDFRFYYV
ncbi:phage tail protein [Bacillus cereus]|nr:phage tail protein [Bacillus cereus]PGU69795.1 phage tail protein [Bacillus cereus]